jgi:hypothetical protein
VRELIPKNDQWEGSVPRYVFGVNVAGTVHVQGADEFEARKVVPAVLLLPGRDEVRMANDSNAKIGWAGIITSVNFRVKGGIALVRRNGKKIERQQRRRS